VIRAARNKSSEIIKVMAFIFIDLLKFNEKRNQRAKFPR